VSFSSSVEPDVIECGYYYGHSGEPPVGTHKNIENRELNGLTTSYGQVAGAMGWYLDSLDPNESVSITVAFMFSHGPAYTQSTIFDKYDDIAEDDCVEPNDYITYTICYANPITDPNDPNYIGTLTNVVITDFLPPEVDIFDVSPSNNGYHSWQTQTVSGKSAT